MLFFHLLAALNAEWRCWGIKQLGNSHKSAIHKFRWASEEVDILCILGAVVFHQMGLHSPLHVSFNFLLKKLHGLPEVCASWDFRQMFETSAQQNIFLLLWIAEQITEQLDLLIILVSGTSHKTADDWVYMSLLLWISGFPIWNGFQVVWSCLMKRVLICKSAAERVWRLGMQANQETPPVRPCKTSDLEVL